MKCPKCHYLSFEPEPRCRNCGYDLSIAEPEHVDDDDLSIRAADPPEGPLVDLQLRRSDEPAPAAPVSLGPMRKWEAESPAPAVARMSLTESAGLKTGGSMEQPVVRPAIKEPPAPPARTVASTAAVVEREATVAAAPSAPPRRSPVTTTDLPLFVKRMTGRDPDSDAPLVKIPAVPRVPLGVRRSSPEPPKSRPKPSENAQRRLGPFDEAPLEDLPAIVRPVQAPAEPPVRAQAQQVVSRPEAGIAGPFKRLTAAFLDAVVLAAIGSGVVWITLKFCQLTIDEARALPLLPLVPLVAFLLLIDLGYLLMFTAAGGQTPGKMAAHIRVVGVSLTDGSPTRLTPRQAGYRALLTLPSVLALGAGFLPALIRGEAFHDRISHTRVIRA